MNASIPELLSDTSRPATDAMPGAARRDSPWPGRLRAAVLVGLGWLAFTLLTTAVTWTFLRGESPDPPPFAALLRWQAVAPSVWFVLTPLIVGAARRWRFSRSRWPASAAVHLGLAVSVHLLVATVELAAWPALRHGTPPAAAIALTQGLVFRVLLYAGIVAAVQAAYHHRRFVEGRTQALELRAQLLDARVRSLSLQLEPHFLFNTLNAISELVHRDADLADRAIMRLADLLRRTTALGGRTQVPLRDELLLLRDYADLLQLRWGDGLRITVEAGDAALPVPVPPLLLQPLVENAVRHGIRGRDRGRVRVEARREGDVLALTVDDDGAGLGGAAIREGLGLGNTRLRLQHLHGDAASVTLGASPLGGTRVAIRLPAVAATGPAGPADGEGA